MEARRIEQQVTSSRHICLVSPRLDVTPGGTAAASPVDVRMYCTRGISIAGSLTRRFVGEKDDTGETNAYIAAVINLPTRVSCQAAGETSSTDSVSR